jgi:serine/threonine-protein kinase
LISALAGDDGGNISVPDVVNMPEAEALESLDEAGLEGDVERVANAEFAEGIVFEQDPGKGEKLDRGDTVNLKVSSGAGEVEIPDLEGETQTDAEAALQELEFDTEVQYETNDEIGGLLVIRTEPEAGTLAATGSTVTLIVSSGREVVAIPNVDNLPEEEAQARINDADFVARLESEAHATVPEGQVIRTEPAGGTQAPKGSAVTIVVSSGPSGVVVPQLLGQTQEDAEAQLAQLGLNSSVIRVQSPGNEGRVVEQLTPAGEEVPAGTVIVLRVGQTAPATTTTTAAPGNE